MKKKHVLLLVILLAGAAAALGGGLLYFSHHGGEGFACLKGIPLHGNIQRLKSLILSFGFWAPLISASLMVAQSVILFLPAFPIFVVNALVFGPVWGAFLSWGSAVLGSILCFTIAKTLGRPFVLRLVNRVHLAAADRALKKYEKYVILVFGFIPVISFDVISYASGLTILTYGEFILLVCIAQAPSAVFYTFFVHSIDRETLDVYWVFVVALFFVLGIGGVLMRSVVLRYWKRAPRQIRKAEPGGSLQRKGPAEDHAGITRG